MNQAPVVANVHISTFIISLRPVICMGLFSYMGAFLSLVSTPPPNSINLDTFFWCSAFFHSFNVTFYVLSTGILQYKRISSVYG